MKHDQLIQKMVKLEMKNEALAKSLKMANKKIGVEYIADSDSSSESLSDSEHNLEVPNTREYQRDFEFANKYFYITDVKS